MSSRFNWKDPSLLLIALSNGFIIQQFITGALDLLTVMVIYWYQSVIIGAFNVVKILTLKEFSTENFKMNGTQPPANTTTKYYVAIFFAVHYGMFHLGYAVFLMADMFMRPLSLGASSVPSIVQQSPFYLALPLAGIFLISHLSSFMYHKKWSQPGQNIGTLMFSPYSRIIPMHFTILFGGFIIPSIFPLFISLKTGADLLMHIIENKNSKSVETILN